MHADDRCVEPGQSGQARAATAAAQADALEAQARQLLERAGHARQAAARIDLGNDGEQVIGGLLEQLVPDGWVVLHDRRRQPGSPANLDHVLVGPPGVFVVDTKNWTGGRLRLDDRGMAVGRWRKDDELHSANVDADIVGAHVQAAWPHAQTVGVIAFVQDMGLPGPLEHQRVLLAQREHLLPALRRLPAELTPQHVTDVAAALERHLPSRLSSRAHRPAAATGPVPPSPGHPGAPARTGTSADRPRSTARPLAPPPAAPPTAAQRRRVRDRDKARRQLKASAIKLAVVFACIPAAPWVIEHVVAVASPYVNSHVINHLAPTPTPGGTDPLPHP